MFLNSLNPSPQTNHSVANCPNLLTPLSLITLFHLNLAFSSIEIDQRPAVIEKCYWPLLRLARDLQLPVGIEATGYTLEVIADLDPKWLEELRGLISTGTCEFIGSGYAQIIGPIIPYQVNQANLYWGDRVYQNLLGIHPQIALVNEQAYSASLVPHYLQAGYQAIIMEWNNPARYHREWSSEWRYFPQYACSQTAEKIPVIWNNSNAFQKFQKYVHEELDRHEYVEDFLASHQSENARTLMMYGNDAEIFNFRPGRYIDEAELKSDEWQKIYDLIKSLQQDPRFKFIDFPTVLQKLEATEGGHSLSLESTADPIPVKKQRKYNVTRWAVTGTDLEINTQCWALYQHIKDRAGLEEPIWKELCYLWSSDFRTHITVKRFQAYQERLNALAAQLGVSFGGSGLTAAEPDYPIPAEVNIDRQGKFLILETAEIKLRLNCDRGVCIDRLWFKAISSDWLCGSLPHGYYDDIDWLEDHFSGHLVFQSPGNIVVEDLQPVQPTISFDPQQNRVLVTALIETPLGMLKKQLGIEINSARIHLGYELNWPRQMMGYLRLGYLMVNPAAFERESLYFATHNGGSQLETFSLSGESFDHHSPVSSTVSSMCGLGVTEGEVILGDRHHQIQVKIDKAQAALLGMITFESIGSSYFLRLAFSARELDETAKPDLLEMVEPQAPCVYRLCLTASPQSESV